MIVEEKHATCGHDALATHLAVVDLEIWPSSQSWGVCLRSDRRLRSREGVLQEWRAFASVLASLASLDWLVTGLAGAFEARSVG